MNPQAKVGDQVIWLDTLGDRNEVEIGSVIGVFKHKGKNIYALCWLEGYKSRNDDINDDRLFAIYDKTCPVVKFSNLSGPSRVTEAGQKWLDEQEKNHVSN